MFYLPGRGVQYCIKGDTYSTSKIENTGGKEGGKTTRLTGVCGLTKARRGSMIPCDIT